MDRMWRECRGGISLWWVALDGEPARCVAAEADGLTRDQLLERARIAAQVQHDKDRIEESLRARFPDAAIAESPLPMPDVAWGGEEGWYIYALAARRRHGKYQVLDAVPVPG